MKIKKLAELLLERCNEEKFECDSEILIEDENGFLCDFTVEDTEEAFDGFETFYPAGLKIVIKRE